MLAFNPKRSSRLIFVMNEWCKKIDKEIKKNKNNEQFIFSFLLRDPLDNLLHMCVGRKTLTREGNGDKLKDFVTNGNPSIMDALVKCFGENSNYDINNNKFQALKNDISTNSGEDFITPFLSLLHEFPYPRTENCANDGENLNFTCIDDSLYYLEELKRQKIEDDLIDVLTKTTNSGVSFQIPGINFYKEKWLIQNATENANEYVKIITKIRIETNFQNGSGLWIPIRNGNEFKKGRILGFVNFTCGTEDLKKCVKKYLQKYLELIQFQLNTAFFEGTLFEIEKELEDLANTPLLEKTNKLIKRFFSLPKNGTSEKADIRVDYNDIPYEYRKEQNSSILEFKNGLPVDCSCNEISKNNCTDDCIAYQKNKILGLIIKLVQKKDQEKEILKHGTRTAIAAIMSREDSHNIGSHVLASLNQDVIRNRPFDVERLMNYIQQRWDFIAGIIPGYPGWSEPLFFFSEILNGFFEQGLLIDYLIKDDGVGGNIIRFHIKYKTRSITFVKRLFVRLGKNGQREEEEVELNVEDIKNLENYDKERIKKITKIKELGNGIEIKEIEVKFVSELSKDGNPEETEIEDFLVDIPGGVVGCHAFYCILENIMRNAAKHSYKGKTGTFFEIFINIVSIEDDSGNSNLFSITIFDNCSKENDHFKIANIQVKLKEDLVDRKGEIVSKDWGIQVIKLGAKYLRSPCEEDTITVDALTEEKKDGKYLAYKFKIRKPRLVTVADYNACVPEKDLAKGIKTKSVKDNRDLENLVKDFFPQLLIILPKEDENEIKKILNFLAENNLKFPARILLCGSNEDHAKQIKKTLCTLEKDRIIPKRRCFVGIWWNPKKWKEKFIIRAYKEWVCSFGKIENSINIVAYFDRIEDHPCFKRWTKLCDKTLEEFELENSIKLSIYGKGKNGNDKAIKVVGEEFNINNHKNIILFDNHGKLGNETVTISDGNGSEKALKLKDGCLHYHSIGSDSRSGFNNRCIFDTLTNVSPGFSGVFALLLLIESAITKVLVIDERVAKSLVQNISQSQELKEKYIQPNNRLDSLQASGCFVPFFLRWHDRSKCLIKEYNEEIQRIASDNKKKEGLWFDSNGLKIEILKNKRIEQIPEVDFVVIHRGIFETFLKEVNVDINTFTNFCKNISPKLLITSGRGNTNNNNDEMNCLPFLEYSVLQRFIIQEFAKYQMCSILFSVR